MIYIKPVPASDTTPTSNTAPWRQRFAFLPQCVGINESDNTKTYVWLGIYESRVYYDQNEWWYEFRLPDEQKFWKVNANRNNCY